jgi:hypothetical protein
VEIDLSNLNGEDVNKYQQALCDVAELSKTTNTYNNYPNKKRRLENNTPPEEGPIQDVPEPRKCITTGYLTGIKTGIKSKDKKENPIAYFFKHPSTLVPSSFTWVNKSLLVQQIRRRYPVEGGSVQAINLTEIEFHQFANEQKKSEAECILQLPNLIKEMLDKVITEMAKKIFYMYHNRTTFQ